MELEVNDLQKERNIFAKALVNLVDDGHFNSPVVKLLWQVIRPVAVKATYTKTEVPHFEKTDMYNVVNHQA